MKNNLIYLMLVISSTGLIGCSSSSKDTIKPELAEVVDSQTTQSPPTGSTTINEPARSINGFGEQQLSQYVIAVTPTIINNDIRLTRNLSDISSNNLSQRLSHEIMAELTHTNKFIVLADSAPTQSCSDAGCDHDENLNNQTKPAVAPPDFTLNTHLNALTLHETEKYLKVTGRSIISKKLYAVISYQLIDNKTHQLISAKTLRYENDVAGNNNSKQSVEQIISNLAAMIKFNLLDQIYPINIVSISQNKQAVLDQSLTIGTVCTIFTQGDKVHDPYSGKFLGYEEHATGSVKVIHSSSNLSYAEITSGYAAKGDLCKRQQFIDQRRPELIKQTQQGGVILPFD